MRRLTLAAAILTLIGCADRVDAVQERMAQIRSEPALPIEAPPVFNPIQSFSYSAENLRSPFVPPSLERRIDEQARMGGPVMPDLSRPKEQLEQFEIDQLVMRGIIQDPSGSRYALIEDPAGTLVPARVGNYIGRNFGRIVEITPQTVNIIEIVPDGGRGFVERPKTMLAPDAQAQQL